jgi:uncharacterized protein (TIGR03435 family)
MLRKNLELHRILMAGTILLSTFPSPARPQSYPRFEIATLKLSPPPEGDLININLGTFRNGRLTLTNVTLNDVIKFAYELSSESQLVGPDWNRSVRFDIVALAPPGTPPEQLHRMTQDLLAERLHVVLRKEQRVLRYLALVVGKNGAKLQPAKPDPPPNPGPQIRGRISHNQMSMALLASLLSRFERQTIVDLTGISGLFEVKLDWSPDKALAPEDLSAPPPESPGLFAAVQEQLGLKLESRRGPLEVLIVDQASKVPEGN